MRKLEWPLALLAALAIAAFLFRGNLHTDDTGIVAGLLLLSAVVLAFVFRKAGLLFGSLLGCSIVLSELWNLRTGAPRPHMARLSDFALLFLFVTALSVVGSLAGYGARRALKRLSTSG
jgi:hypothetical protein